MPSLPLEVVSTILIYSKDLTACFALNDKYAAKQIMLARLKQDYLTYRNMLLDDNYRPANEALNLLFYFQWHHSMLDTLSEQGNIDVLRWLQQHKLIKLQTHFNSISLSFTNNHIDVLEFWWDYYKEESLYFSVASHSLTAGMILESRAFQWYSKKLHSL